jgi:DNA-binding PadR family transcriptional regulator
MHIIQHIAMVFQKIFFRKMALIIFILTTFKSNIGLMSQYHLGEFEEVVLLTVAILYNEAYGVAIIDEMEKRLNRQVSIGALQTVLRRLENKGLLTSAFGEATKIRGGKRKRYFRLTQSGHEILNQTKDQRLALWKSIPKVAFK